MPDKLLISLAAREFCAEVTEQSGVLTVCLSGTGDMCVAEEFERFVMQLHGTGLELGVEHVVVDLRRLEFMSATCLRGLVRWLVALAQLPADRQYSICFRSDPRLLWQRRSMRSLAAMAAGLVSVSSGCDEPS